MRRPDPKNAEPSQRILRVAELVRHAAAEALSRGDFDDPVLNKQIVTVPLVKMSPDLKLATLFVMPLGGKKREQTLAALERNKKVLRTLIAQRVNLKFAPDLRFLLDESFDAQSRLDALLNSPRVARDLASDEGDDEAKSDDV